MKYIVRERNKKDEIVIESSHTLNFFYDNFFGRLFIKLLTSNFVTNIVGKYMNSKLSLNRINKFIKENNINMNDYVYKEYTSYNDFFIRKIKYSKRPIFSNKDVLISPCDSKLSVYTINNNLTLKIKDAYYDINTLIDKDILDEYKEGYALVFRLSTNDYHRYCYIDSGTKSKNYYIKGTFHTVQPISLKHYNFYKTNTREWTELYTNNFDKVIDIDIGALCIGKINNYHEEISFKKGEEKGYFEFGGSTIVLLFKKNTIILDEDIMANSKDNIETVVKYGEKIGNKYLK
jgi:phosphatidylserine decarboxylase